MPILLNNHLTHFQTIYSQENKSRRTIHIIFDKHTPEKILLTLASFNTRPLNFNIEAYYIDESHEQTLISLSTDMFESDDVLLYVGHFAGHKSLFDAFQLTSKPFNAVCLLSSFNKSSTAAHFLELSKPYLKALHLIGNQIHLSDPQLLEEQSRLGLRIGLGQINLNLDQVEPFIRVADLCSIDFSVLANHQLLEPSADHPSTGITTQQLAQCIYYAGRAPYVKFLGMEISSIAANENHQLIATMIWYFIYGLSYQQNLNSANLDEFVLPSESPYYGEMHFFKDQANQQWWLQNPDDKADLRWRYIPCDYSHYRNAASGELDPYLMRMIELFQTI